MQLRQATLDDLEMLQYWNTKPHVSTAFGEDELFEWDKELERNVDWQEILIAELDNRPIGVIQIIDPSLEESHYWGEIEANLRAIDIWIGEEFDLGKGYGTEMMQLALSRCFSDSKVKAILVDPIVSNKQACHFYEQLGFKCIERRRFVNDDCFVYRLERSTWDI